MPHRLLLETTSIAKKWYMSQLELWSIDGRNVAARCFGLVFVSLAWGGFGTAVHWQARQAPFQYATAVPREVRLGIKGLRYYNRRAGCPCYWTVDCMGKPESGSHPVVLPRQLVTKVRELPYRGIW